MSLRYYLERERTKKGATCVEWHKEMDSLEKAQEACDRKNSRLALKGKTNKKYRVLVCEYYHR